MCVRIPILLNRAPLMKITSVPAMVGNNERDFSHTHPARTSIGVMCRRGTAPWYSAENTPLAVGQVHRAVFPEDVNLASRWHSPDVDTNENQPKHTSKVHRACNQILEILVCISWFSHCSFDSAYYGTTREFSYIVPPFDGPLGRPVSFTGRYLI